MNASEAAILLARISASDNREVSEAAARAWADSLPDVALSDALDFLPEFYRNATRDTKNWIYPGDVLAGVVDLHVGRRREAMRLASQDAPEWTDETHDPKMTARIAALKAYNEAHPFLAEYEAATKAAAKAAAKRDKPMDVMTELSRRQSLAAS